MGKDIAASLKVDNGDGEQVYVPVTVSVFGHSPQPHAHGASSVTVGV